VLKYAYRVAGGQRREKISQYELGNKPRSEINSAFDNRNPLHKAVAALGEYRRWIIVGVAKRGAEPPYHLMNLVCVFLEKSSVHQVSYDQVAGE
jgi:hypothetical protein